MHEHQGGKGNGKRFNLTKTCELNVFHAQLNRRPKFHEYQKEIRNIKYQNGVKIL